MFAVTAFRSFSRAGYAWSVLCLAVGVPLALADERSDDPAHRDGGMVFRLLTPVSREFQSQASAALQSIPGHVQHRIATSGWQLQLAEFVIDAEPALAAEQPRGWPAGMTWANTDAIHFPSERRLVMAEKRRTKQGVVVSSTRIAGVLRHELGHAFDMVLGSSGQFRSAAPDFRQAYAKDLARIPAEIASQLGYYLQDSTAGRQEAFAEAFGVVLGGGSDVTQQDLFRAHFPAVLELVRRDLLGESR